MNRAVIVSAQAAIVVILLVTLLVQAVVIPLFASEAAFVHPEVGWLSGPGMLWAIAVVACGQAVLICTFRLLGMVSRGRIFQPVAFRWVAAMIAACLVAAALTASALIGFFALGLGPGSVPIALIAAAATFVGVALVLVVMRGLLAQAASFERELAVVV